MRMIGLIKNEAAASSFRDYLLVQGIENQLEKESDGTWSVWVHADDELDRASRFLAEFRDKPDDSRFHLASAQAAQLRAREQADRESFDKRFHDRGDVFHNMAGYGIGPLTLILIIFSGLVFLQTGYGYDEKANVAWYISNPFRFNLRIAGGNLLERLFSLPEIRQGQVWRLITPIFLHVGLMHILFNMLFLRDLGSMIEARLSSLYLALLVVVIGITSNLAQYAVSGPRFCGMSGVVYGLLGYIWIRGKYDPFCGLILHKTTVTMMLIVYFACLTVIPNVANTVHTVGLLVGMLWGYIDAKR